MTDTAQFDSMLLTAESIKGLGDLIPAPVSFMGIRVIQSPLAVQDVPDGARLKPAWDLNNGSHYVLEKKTKRVHVAIMFNSRMLLDYVNPLPPIYKRDLAAFQDGSFGIINVAMAV